MASFLLEVQMKQLFLLTLPSMKTYCLTVANWQTTYALTPLPVFIRDHGETEGID
jgi:hypothetical protein